MFTTIVGALWVLFILFIVFRTGLFKGRRYGNKVAAHIGIPKRLFHALLDSTPGPSTQFLSVLKDSSPSLDHSALVLSPYMMASLDTLQNRFGRQPMLDAARPIVERLYRQHKHNLEAQREQ
ncbi:hypothetical protein [Hydrogenophaga defluvii]|uniref:Uncharacterized protein n=1 Tax=Hydrogenophaga defluvii TaxID=249410 RepID=A0ABW2SFN1_9BURK